MFFKQLVAWLGPSRKDIPLEDEPVWPEEIWARMFAMMRYAEKLTLCDINVSHYDITVLATTTSIHQLFRRMEIMIDVIDNQADTPSWWKDRNRDKQPYTIVEYYYDARNGYHQPQVVLEKLIEKVMVIHHLIESQDITPRHNYYHYMLKEFFQLVSDIVEVFTASIEMSKLQ